MLTAASTRRTYGALGDDVNLAARLMSAAVPGEVVVSGGVRKEVAEQFSFEPRPPLPLKGKAEPLPVFAVIGQRSRRATRLRRAPLCAADDGAREPNWR